MGSLTAPGAAGGRPGVYDARSKLLQPGVSFIGIDARIPVVIVDNAQPLLPLFLWTIVA
jgi:hypothetical protein